MRKIYAAAITLSVSAASTLDYNIEVQNLPQQRQNHTFWMELGDVISLTAVIMAHHIINERVNEGQNTLVFPTSQSFQTTEQNCLNQALDRTAPACSLSIATAILLNKGDNTTIPTGSVNDDDYSEWIDEQALKRLLGAFRPILPDANSGSSSIYTIKYDILTAWPAMLMGVTDAEETKCVDEAFVISMDGIASCSVLKTIMTSGLDLPAQNFSAKLSRRTSSSNTWEIVGIVIGSVVGAALIVTAVYCACRRKRKPALHRGRSKRESRSELDMRPLRRQERERIGNGALRV